MSKSKNWKRTINEWIKNYGTAYGTLALAIATFVLVLCTINMLNATQDNVNIMTKMYTAENRPVVFIETIEVFPKELDISKNELKIEAMIYIKNIGKQPAYNVSLQAIIYDESGCEKLKPLGKGKKVYPTLKFYRPAEISIPIAKNQIDIVNKSLNNESAFEENKFNLPKTDLEYILTYNWEDSKFSEKFSFSYIVGGNEVALASID